MLFRLLIVMLALGLAGPAFAARSPTTSAVAPARPPMGFVKFCIANFEHCAPSSDAVITLTTAVKQDLVAINDQVNGAISPRNDSADTWRIGGRQGDCEDYVLTKRAELATKGLPIGALRIAVTRAGGTPHAVLVVKTNQGDYVLDNLAPGIRKLSETGYRLTSISGANPLRWTAG